MTTEEKAKAYDEAIERANNHRNHDGLTLEQYETIDIIFPELKESEDEKIRKDLLNFLKSPFIKDNICDWRVTPWIAWLEKQGEKGTKGNDREIPFDAWSEEDNEHLGRILKELENQRQRPINISCLDKIESDYNWLKSLKDRVQPKQGWSEDDEECIKWSINNLTELKDRFGEEYGKVGDCINWLKSLRLQKQWRPSEKQTKALSDVLSLKDIKYDVLSELWKDLEKLM